MIYIIRHGQTEGNVAKQLQGRRDVPLNETGKKQARDASKRLRDAGVSFSRVLTSPLGRARETARLVAGDIAQVVDERLIEMDYGPYGGTSMLDPAPEVLAFFKDFVNTPAPHGMEPLNEVVERLGGFLEDIKEIASCEDVLVSTHAIAMKGALEYLTPESQGAYWSKYIANCAIYVCQVDVSGNWLVPSEWLG